MSERKKRVFIVEDQRLISADLETTLTKLGYDVAGSVASGEEAVGRALELEPDLVLMDIRLVGEIDGIEAAARIRAARDVPVVYLTAYADEETIVRAKETAPYGYVVKPFHERELRAAVEVALHKHENERALAAERAGRRAAEQFKLLVEGVRDYAIFMLDARGQVTTWAAGAERVLGYRADEILARPFALLYPDDDVARGRPAAALAEAARAGSFEERGWRVKKGGARHWAETVITPLPDDGGLPGFVCVVRDVTEQMREGQLTRALDRATAALAASLEVSAMLEQAAAGVVPGVADRCVVELADDEGRLVEVAAAPVAAAGTASSTSALERGPLHVFLTGKAEARHDIEEGSALPCVEHARERGEPSSLAVPIHFRGRALGVVTLQRAGEPPRRFTAAELTFAEELARRMALAVDNARLYRDAKEAIKSRDEFLQIASHELKTPLTPLLLQLESTARALEKAGVQNVQLSEKLAMATRQTTRLNRLVESLLDVSRITAGRIVLEREAVDLAESLRDVAARFREEAAKAGSALLVDATEPIVGRWDRLRLEQILTNLISNAIKYGAGRPIEVRARVDGAVARVSVTDHGIGIERDAMSRIFGRFERAVSARHFGGLGLGLFIARQFAEAHGGSVVVQSEPGAGSTFTVVLPLDPAGPGTAAGDATDARQ